MPSIFVKIPETLCETIRLDQYIASIPQGMNRSKLKSTAQEILLNGKNAKLSSKVKKGDVIEILWEDNIPTDIEPENIPLKIIYEDENVTVVNKDSGMVTHPALGNWSKTLVNALLYHWKKEAVPQKKDVSQNEILKSRRPGIVHRLDKDTSGIIITAKNRETEEYLSSQFKERLVQKEYILICKGRPPASSGDVKTQIVRDSKNRKKFKALTDTTDGKFARSIYHCISCYGPYSVVRVRIKTGRTHQIRVHMKYLGCQILGDKLYSKTDENFPDVPLMLHSRKLVIKLPGKEKYHCFKAQIPSRFYEVLKKLKKKYPKEVMPRVKCIR